MKIKEYVENMREYLVILAFTEDSNYMYAGYVWRQTETGNLRALVEKNVRFERCLSTRPRSAAT